MKDFSLTVLGGKMQTIQNLLRVTSCVLPNPQHPDPCTIVDDISIKASTSSWTKVLFWTSKVKFQGLLEYFLKTSVITIPQHKKIIKK